MSDGWLLPDWPAPSRVRAAVSTRLLPGHSQPPYERFNLGVNSGDALDAVRANRAAVTDMLSLPSAPHWLQQVHGIDVMHVDAGAEAGGVPARADASVTTHTGQPLAILTADCLPVLFCTRDGSAVAAAHAGWRGLQAGVLEATLHALPASPDQVLAWLGPCIGALSYEVGEEVRDAFLASDPGADACFQATRPGHWWCDLAALARRRLRAAGVLDVYGGGFDTLTDMRFYSYRRDAGHSGRFVSLIWLTD